MLSVPSVTQLPQFSKPPQPSVVIPQAVGFDNLLVLASQAGTTSAHVFGIQTVVVATVEDPPVETAVVVTLVVPPVVEEETAEDPPTEGALVEVEPSVVFVPTDPPATTPVAIELPPPPGAVPVVPFAVEAPPTEELPASPRHSGEVHSVVEVELQAMVMKRIGKMKYLVI